MMLGEEIIVQEFSSKSIAFAIIQSHVDELRIFPIDSVMIANQLDALLFFGHNE
jgi:hypothetical protein